MEDLKYIKYVEESNLNEINFYCNNDYIINSTIYGGGLTFIGVLHKDKLYSSCRYKFVRQAINLLKGLFINYEDYDRVFKCSDFKKYRLLKNYKEDMLHATRFIRTGRYKFKIHFNNDVIVNIEYIRSDLRKFFITSVNYESQEFDFYNYNEIVTPFEVKTIIELLKKECDFICGLSNYNPYNLMYGINYKYIKNAVVDVTNKALILFDHFSEAMEYKNLIKEECECFVIHNNKKWLTLNRNTKELTLKLILNELDYDIIDYRNKGGDNK